MRDLDSRIGLDFDELYAKYCEFSQAATESIMSKLRTEAHRLFYQKHNAIWDRISFEIKVKEMDPSVRTQYIQNLRLGWKESVKQSSGPILELIKEAARTVQERN